MDEISSFAEMQNEKQSENKGSQIEKVVKALAYLKRIKSTENLNYVADDERVYRVPTGELRILIRKISVEVLGRSIPRACCDEIMAIIADEIDSLNESLDVHLRYAQHLGKNYVNTGERLIEIDSCGWRFVEQPPAGLYFIKTKKMKPIHISNENGDINLLKRYLNLQDEDDFKLLVVWILACISKCEPYPCLVITGEQGSCKSSFMRFIKEMIDPENMPTRSVPRSEEDLLIAASNSFLLCFDNISEIQNWLSDAFCRLVTGGGISKRKQYSDLDEVCLSAKRPFVLNGIGEFISRSDLLDRAIILHLPRVLPEKRLSEKKLNESFQADVPKIIRGLVEVLCKTLAEIPKIELTQSDRMADFYCFGLAAEKAFGWSSGDFARAFEKNKRSASVNLLDHCRFYPLLERFLKKIKFWQGTATTLLGLLKFDSTDSLDEKKALPQSAAKLAIELTRIAPNLRKNNIEFESRKTPGSNSQKIITLIYHQPTDASDAKNLGCVDSVDKNVDEYEALERVAIWEEGGG